MFSLKNKVVMITGGYGHLGGAITNGLAGQGATVFVLGKDRSKFDDVFSAIPAIQFQMTDVADTISIRSAFESIQKQAGRIDVLINNAFYLKGQDPETLSDDDWNFGIDGTLGSTFRCMREIIPYFKNQLHGKIINVSSMYGMVSPDFSIYEQFPTYLNPPHYGAAKAAVIQLTRYYAAYLAKYNINVNCVSPGPFPSDTVQESKQFIQQLRHKVPLDRIGKPDDLKGIFVFLSSDESNYVTGQNIPIDGGWTIC